MTDDTVESGSLVKRKKCRQDWHHCPISVELSRAGLRKSSFQAPMVEARGGGGTGRVTGKGLPEGGGRGATAATVRVRH